MSWSLLPRLSLRSGLVALTVLASAPSEARAPTPVAMPSGTLQASYTMLLSGITIGRFRLDAVFDRSNYSMIARGATSGMSRFVSDGTGLLKSSGHLAGADVQPANYYLDTTENGRTNSLVSMRMKAGTISSVTALPPLMQKADRVPILAEHKRQIVDPLSAMIAPLYKSDMGRACNRSIPVFDGWQRFDIRLHYKSTAQVHGENGSYSGPVVVCSARYVPVAGHRPSRESVRFMENNKDLEVWLAPVDDLGLMLPFRMQIGTEVGVLTIHASRFVAQANSQRASAE